MKPLKLSKVVRAAGADGGEAAALRGVGIDPFEVLEVGRILEVAEGGEAMPARLLRRAATPAPGAAGQQRRHCTCASALQSQLPHHSFAAPALSPAPRRAAWPPPRRTTTPAGTRTLRDGSLAGPPEHVPHAPGARTACATAAPRSGSTAARGRARAWRRPGPSRSLARMILSISLSIGRVLDADDVAAAFLVGGFRAPEVALLVAGRQRLREARNDDVEVEGVVRGADTARCRRCARWP